MLEKLGWDGLGVELVLVTDNKIQKNFNFFIYNIIKKFTNPICILCKLVNYL
jgi:hypothetical protein